MFDLHLEGSRFRRRFLFARTDASGHVYMMFAPVINEEIPYDSLFPLVQISLTGVILGTDSDTQFLFASASSMLAKQGFHLFLRHFWTHVDGDLGQSLQTLLPFDHVKPYLPTRTQSQGPRLPFYQDLTS